jgi:hypothetical protein
MNAGGAFHARVKMNFDGRGPSAGTYICERLAGTNQNASETAGFSDDSFIHREPRRVAECAGVRHSALHAPRREIGDARSDAVAQAARCRPDCFRRSASSSLRRSHTGHVGWKPFLTARTIIVFGGIQLSR